VIDIALATAPENNVVVHAAAGTGKTWLLTSRIVRLLLAGSAPGAILAITFTRKAAGEIHQRVTERLRALAGSDDAELAQQLAQVGVEPDAATREAARGMYEKHLGAIHALRATTFHAFCQDILRRFPLEADIPPNFELLETTSELEEAAWLALDRKISRDQDNELARAMDILLQEHGSLAGARQALDEFLGHRGDWWAFTENDSDPVAAATARLEKTMRLSDGDTDPIAGYLEDARIRGMLARYGELLAAHATATNQKFAEKLARALSGNLSPERAFGDVGEVFFKTDGDVRQMKVNPTLTRKLGADRAQELVELHHDLAQRHGAAQALANRRRTLRLSSAWYACGQAWLGEYQRLKAERGMLDFTDLEWKTCRLLNRGRHAEWVQYKLDQRIDHLLVDEFQDTNPTQWRLLQPLLEEIVAGDPERRRSVFLVGDEKQSIYRFRRADPRLFHAARHWLEQHARARTFAQHISWRSSPAIIRFVNFIFHGAGEAGHDPEEDFVLQDFLPHDTRHGQLWGRAELLPLIKRANRAEQGMEAAWRNPLEQPRQTEEDSRHRSEGDLIAARIRELLGSPVLDRGRVRPLHGGDVMILLRDRAHARFYEEALRRAGIPYIGTGRGAFLQSLEVRDLIQLLHVLIEPYNDLALAVVLRSPIFAATDADLVRLAQNPPGPWRERLARLSAPTLFRAQDLLARWSRLADRIPVHDLLDRIYRDGNLIARYVAAAPRHLRSRVEANLNRFLELALEVDSGRYPSLSHFLAHLERRAGDDTEAPAEPAWNREPRVRVMTIHAAKGLEAPVVFLADAARDTGSRERGVRALVDWPVAAAQPRHFHLIGRKETIDDVSQALLHEQRRSIRSEEANLLYVALTRARQMLFVSGCEPGRGGRGWYGFIEKRLRRAAQDAEAVRAGLELLEGEDATVHGRIVFGEPAAIDSGPAGQPAQTPTLDPALTRPLPLPVDDTMANPSRLAQRDNPAPEEGAAAGGARSAQQRRGVAIHRMLEQLAGDAPRAAVEARLRRELDAVATAAEFNAWWREASAVVDDVALRDLFDPGRYRHAYNEIPILFRDGARDVYGVIDRLVVREQEIILVDYKTHAQACAENIAQLAQDYVGQMRQYGAGARRLWPRKKTRLLLLFTACRGSVEIPPE
jgi:ATP-dependent helicase/nuclease subunit A